MMGGAEEMEGRLLRFFGNEKFMWDGAEFADEELANKKKQRYLDDGFEVRTVQDGTKILLYTRRNVTESRG